MAHATPLLKAKLRGSWGRWFLCVAGAVICSMTAPQLRDAFSHHTLPAFLPLGTLGSLQEEEELEEHVCTMAMEGGGRGVEWEPLVYKSAGNGELICCLAVGQHISISHLCWEPDAPPASQCHHYLAVPLAHRRAPRLAALQPGAARVTAAWPRGVWNDLFCLRGMEGSLPSEPMAPGQCPKTNPSCLR